MRVAIVIVLAAMLIGGGAFLLADKSDDRPQAPAGAAAPVASAPQTKAPGVNAPTAGGSEPVVTSNAGSLNMSPAAVYPQTAATNALNGAAPGAGLPPAAPAGPAPVPANAPAAAPAPASATAPQVQAPLAKTVAAADSGGPVYRCDDRGRVTYQNSPCTGGKVREVKIEPPIDYLPDSPTVAPGAATPAPYNPPVAPAAQPSAAASVVPPAQIVNPCDDIARRKAELKTLTSDPKSAIVSDIVRARERALAERAAALGCPKS